MLPLINVGFDLNIFKTLSESSEPVSVEQIAKPFDADPILISRIVRYLGANGLIEETSQDHYIGNSQTKLLADPVVQGALYHVFNVTMPANQVLPKYLKENKYQNKTNGYAPFNMSQNTELAVFDWEKAEKREDLLKAYHCFMSLPRPTEWYDVYPMDNAGSRISEDKKVFVDVGGSTGHQCRRLLAKYPELKGRVVLEDLPQVIAVAAPIDGVEMIGYNMFEGQPVHGESLVPDNLNAMTESETGAKYYYSRNVLHDWEDDKCIEVLKNLVPALGPDSLILLDGLVLPDSGAHWMAAGYDIQMFMMHGATERTLSQWTALVEQAGLVVVDVKWYNRIGANAIMEVALPTSCGAVQQ